jgi:cytochrome c-type biogenesis protein CcmE
VDLTPRTATEPGAQPPIRKRRWLPILVVVGALLGGGVIVTQFLTSAIDYYCNVDEIGVRSGCDGERRMRVQGVVEQDSVKQADGGTTFILDFNKKTLQVAYSGDPGGVFQECIPIIAHGRMVDGVFESDRIEVKHSNQYVEKNATRIDESNKEAAACSVLKG